MSKPYLQVFNIKGMPPTTSVVLDKAEFDAFCDELSSIIDIQGKHTDTSVIENIKAQNHLPMMARGTKTIQFFQRWGIKTNHLSVIVRGTGIDMLDQMMDSRRRDVERN